MVQVQPIGDFRLASGQVLPRVEVAYVQFGTLNERGDNAILVTHGYTSGPSMLTPEHHTAEGTWASLLGPGQPLDTERFCIICSNMLGSAFGTTGPHSIRPGTGRPWGQDFPRIELSDIVAVQHALLESLGVRHLRAVLGPSYGGWQALQWAVQYPDWVDAAGAVVSGLTHPPGLSAAAQRERFAACADWNEGDFYAHGGMVQTLQALRWKTLQDYGLERLYTDRYPDPAQRQALMQQQCLHWAERFDPHSMIVLADAAERFDLRERLGEIRCRLWFAVCTTDKIFPPDPAVRERLQRLAIPLRYQEIDSPYGHMASGIEWRQLQEPIRWLTDSPQAD
jgi:homoserine O-acetyltransferase/O-succinyltransferase